MQVYANPPQGRLGKPLRSLAAFRKTEVLQPDGEEILSFRISKKSWLPMMTAVLPDINPAMCWRKDAMVSMWERMCGALLLQEPLFRRHLP